MHPCSTAIRRAATLTSTVVLATVLPLALAGPSAAEEVVPPTTTAAEPVPTATPAPARQQTTVRLSSPTSAPTGSTVRVYARLLADGDGVANGVVDLQRWNGSGWAKVGRIATGADGLGSTGFVLSSSSRLRASYPGTETRTPAVSGSRDVTATRTLGQRAIDEAKRHNGKPYTYGATGPSRFDCSGFTGYVYRQMGKSLPRTSGQQQAALRRVPVSAKQVGDLIFTWRGGRVGHVGIYAGNGTMWAATKSGDVVRTQSIYSRDITVGRIA